MSMKGTRQPNKRHSWQTTANILSSEKKKAFPFKSTIRQGCPLSPLLFNTVLEVLAIAVSQGKKDPNWKGRNKLSLCADGKRVNI